MKKLFGGISCVIWDWNGTLLDDVPVCVEVMNTLLRARGLPEIPSEEYYRSVFAFPVIAYYKALGFKVDAQAFAAVADEYVHAYQRRVSRCALHAGAEELLAAIQTAGLRQAVVSASRQDHLITQAAPFNLFSYFTEMIGSKNNLAESKARLAQDFLKKAQIPPETVLFIGDTLHDFETAASCGSSCVLVAQGHQSVERLSETGTPVFENLQQLKTYFQEKLFL